MTIRCPQCETDLEIPDPDTRQIRCPDCQELVTVPPRLPPVAARAADGFDFAAEAEPPPPTPRDKRKRPAKSGKWPLLLGVVGGGVTAVLIVIVGVVMLTPEPKRQATPKPPPKQVASTPKPKPAVVKPKEKEPEKPPEDDGKRLEALFREPVKELPGKVAVPVLVGQGGGKQRLRVPTLAQWRQARKKETPPAAKGPLSLDDIKKAVAYVKVGGPDPGSGSGFLAAIDGKAGWVATNAHVVESVAYPLLAGEPGGRVGVVFDSGLPTSGEAAGQVVAFDRDTDLALIRVPLPAARPVLDPRLAPPALTETLPVRICGFPFGQALAGGMRNPAITINKGSISSLRRDDRGDVRTVQIDGAINRGNSGGPIVDDQGRLVAVARATIEGAGIGMAVPAADLAALLDGRVASPLFLGTPLKDGMATFRVLVPYHDPLKKIKEVSLLVATEKPADKGEPLPGATKAVLKPAGFFAEGTFTVPEAAGKSVWLQLVCTYGSGEVVAGEPVEVQVGRGSAYSVAGARPLTTVDADADGSTGKVVQLRGYLDPGSTDERGRFHLANVRDEKKGRPQNLDFFVTEELKEELGELPAGTAVPVVVTGLVGKRKVGDSFPVRVLRVAFLGSRDQVLVSLPADEG